MRVRNAELGCVPAGGGEQRGPEFFRVGISDSNGCKYSRLITAAWVQRIKTIIQQLANINNGPLAIGQFHEASIVTAHGC